MKVGIATTLSIAGVLAAGAAAFAVNTSVLSASSSASPSSSTNSTVIESLAPAQVNTVAAAQTPLIKQASISSTPVTSKVTTYAVGTSGSVVIDTTSGAIVVTNVIPAAGWTSEPARTEDNGDVKVHFVSGANRIEFIARMANGAVAVEVRVEQAKPALAALAPAPGMVSPSPTAKPAYRDDDKYENEDHDDDEREDHEDRDEDREEHDEDEDDD